MSGTAGHGHTQADCQTNIVVTFTHIRGDIDAELWNANIQEIALNQGNSETDDEILTARPTTTDTVYLHIFGFNGANNNYTLTIIEDCDV